MSKRVLGRIIVCSVLLVLVSSNMVLARNRLIIDNVVVDNKVLDLQKDSGVKIRYRLSQDAAVVLSIYNDINEKVYEQKKAGKKGECELEWDGKDQEGRAVTNGAYTFIIQAKNEQNSFTYNPAVRTAGLDIQVEEQGFDKEGKEIVYVLPKPGWVQVRVGIKDGPFFDTIVEWEPQRAGRQSIVWDGMSQDGKVNIRAHPQRSVSVRGISLPANSIIVAGSKERDRRERYKLIEQGKVNTRYPMPFRAEVYIPEPEFQVTFPEGVERNEKGIAIVDDTIKLRVELAEQDAERLTNARFEVMFFIDSVFVYEDEQAYTPYNYEWDVSEVSEGEHMLTVNVLGYDRTIGTVNMKVMKRHTKTNKSKEEGEKTKDNKEQMITGNISSR